MNRSNQATARTERTPEGVKFGTVFKASVALLHILLRDQQTMTATYPLPSREGSTIAIAMRPRTQTTQLSLALTHRFRIY